MAVVDAAGGSIEAIDEPSPASQPAVSRTTTGAPWPAIVAMRRPSAEVAIRRAPAGPSVSSPVVGVDDGRESARPASPVTTTSRSSSIQAGGAATTDRSSGISPR